MSEAAVRRESWPYKTLGVRELWRAAGPAGATLPARSRIDFYSDSATFASSCGPEGLDERVKVLDSPLRASDELLEQAARECSALREQGRLTVMRGERGTDLLRPLSPDLAERLRARPALSALITQVESAIRVTGLFLRAIKFDDARASSTSKLADKLSTNLHFDAERATPRTFNGSIRQFYLNLSPTPRHFLIVPVSLGEMIDALGDRTEEPVGHTLQRYIDRFGLQVEVTPAAPFSLVIFDGRAFAHDAGKFTCASFESPEGPLALAPKPDLIAGLDALESNYEHTGYRPEIPFLEDLATAN